MCHNSDWYNKGVEPLHLTPGAVLGTVIPGHEVNLSDGEEVDVEEGFLKGMTVSLLLTL